MNFREFEAALANIERDRRLMTQGDNQGIVNTLISMALSIQHLQRAISDDRLGSEFVFLLSNKLAELESVVMTGGYQALADRGVNILGQGARRPAPAQTQAQPAYNRPSGPAAPASYGKPAAPMAPMPPRPQAHMASVQGQAGTGARGASNESAFAPIAQHTPVAPQRPEPAAQPVPAAPKPSSPASSSAFDDGFVLPGLGGDSDKPASGRDYLLNLLKDS